MKAAGFIACAGAALTLIACHRARTEEPIPPVSHVDLPRYMGRGLSFCWTSSDLDFSGIAKSVVFGGTGVFDNITFDMASVPEPAGFGIFALGLLLMGVFAGLRRRVI